MRPIRLCRRCQKRPVRGWNNRSAECPRCYLRTSGKPLGRPPGSVTRLPAEIVDPVERQLRALEAAKPRWRAA